MLPVQRIPNSWKVTGQLLDYYSPCKPFSRLLSPTYKLIQGSDILDSMMIGLFSTFAGITMYNRFVLGLKGWDQLPRPSLPHLDLSGLRRLFRRDAHAGPGWGSWNTSGGYGHVRAEDNDEEEGFAGRFSLADDEDDEDARALAGDPAVWRNDESTDRANVGGNGNGARSGGRVNL
jgi:cation-dependent mannose-6-phosphate receptor